MTYTTACGNATHWVKPGFKPTSSWILVVFITPEPQREFLQFFFFFFFFFFFPLQGIWHMEGKLWGTHPLNTGKNNIYLPEGPSYPQAETEKMIHFKWVRFIAFSPRTAPQQMSPRQIISIESSLKLQIICLWGRSFTQRVGLITWCQQVINQHKKALI